MNCDTASWLSETQWKKVKNINKQFSGIKSEKAVEVLFVFSIPSVKILEPKLRGKKSENIKM